jgi:hypothetical protein
VQVRQGKNGDVVVHQGAGANQQGLKGQHLHRLKVWELHVSEVAVIVHFWGVKF